MPRRAGDCCTTLTAALDVAAFDQNRRSHDQACRLGCPHDAYLRVVLPR